jgi:hypothetical protein
MFYALICYNRCYCRKRNYIVLYLYYEECSARDVLIYSPFYVVFTRKTRIQCDLVASLLNFCACCSKVTPRGQTTAVSIVSVQWLLSSSMTRN